MLNWEIVSFRSCWRVWLPSGIGSQKRAAPLSLFPFGLGELSLFPCGLESFPFETGIPPKFCFLLCFYTFLLHYRAIDLLSKTIDFLSETIDLLSKTIELPTKTIDLLSKTID